ncbi:MAG: penicillin-binding protein 1C [Chloroflexales bacterium]|nr:penicillin-binding protein 1C [Chloroflexales bacterium]
MSPRLSTGKLRHLRRLIGWGWRSLAAGVALLLLIGAYLWFTTSLPTPEQLRERAALGNTRILDRHGQLLYALPDPLSGRQRPVSLDEIPLTLRQATIATEDADFYANPGVDLRGILRAAWINLRSGDIVTGGSTITQQLARNFLLDPQLAQQRSLERKLREAILAIKLTATYSKDEILALYLNQIYYGGMSYGVEAAAQHFFAKPVWELDLTEAALLTGLPQAPSHYDPFSNPTAAQARQHVVLAAMVREGCISPEQAATAQAEPLQFASADATMRAPHFVTSVLDALTAQLGPDTVLRGGLTITTTLDANLQDAAQETLRQHIAQLATQRDSEPDHQVHNGAVLVLDPTDGAILAMAGSPDFYDVSIQGQVNAALALRQPGSTLKPLTYAAALERGWTPATTILDVPKAFPTLDGRPYEPENYDRTFHGPLTLREALATSSNMAAVRTLHEIGLPALLEMAQRLGISSFNRDSGRYGLALTLGGGEVSLLELTAAYAVFANGGQRVTPYAIIAISDQQAALDRDPAQPRTPFLTRERHNAADRQALSPEIAYLITDILADRYARMRAFGTQSPLDLDRPAAAKTGTTSDWRDNWTIGYTPDRVVGVWAGNADGKPMRHISGIIGAGPVWHDVMLAAHRDLPPRRFERPEDIVELEICAEGGMLTSPTCPATRRERFIAGTQPTQPDTTHAAIPIDPILGCRAPAGYPAARTITRIYRILPPEAEAWAVAEGVPMAPREVCSFLAADRPAPNLEADQEISRPDNQANPSSSPLCPSAQCQVQPALIAPAPGAVFAVSPGIPRERQQLTLQAQAGSSAARVTISIDGETVATFTMPPYRAFWQLEPGRHRAQVEVEDKQGAIWRSEEVEFTVKHDP